MPLKNCHRTFSGPALGELLVAELVDVLKVEQAGHETGGKTRAACYGDTGVGDLERRPEKIAVLEHSIGTRTTRELRGQRRFDPRPGRTTRQHGQLVAKVDHLGQRERKESAVSVASRIAQIPQKSTVCPTNPERFIGS